MQTLTLKVGDLMLQADTIRKSETGPKDVSDQNVQFHKTGLHILRSIGNLFCQFYMKMQIKEVGSSIKCQGRIKFGGTKNVKIGKNCIIGKNVQLETEGRGYIHIGVNVKIGSGVKIHSKNNVTIEDNTHLGEYMIIRDSQSDQPMDTLRNGSKPIYIGKDTWIGRGTRIHAGVTVGHGSTISANSVVTRSIPPKVIAGGTPAKVIMDRIRKDNELT